MVEVEQKSHKEFKLNSEADEIVTLGSHEANIFAKIPDEGMLHAELMKLPNAKLGFSKAIANGWIALDKKYPDGPKVTKKMPTVEDSVQVVLKKLKALELTDIPEKAIQDLKKRKLVAEQ